MSIEHETTAEEIGEILDQHSKFSNAAGPIENPVSPAQCRRWQRAREKGERPATIASASGYHKETVRHHTSGRCSHEHGGDQ